MDADEDIQLPPEDGDSVVVAPRQIPFGPVTETTGLGFMVTAVVG
jgi:hypothetical protein